MPDRKPIVGGNWKMNTNLASAVALAGDVAAGCRPYLERCDVVVFPQSDYSLLNATLGYTRDSWTATLFVDNLTDELAEIFISNEDDIIKTTPNRPRTIGVRFSYRSDAL